MILFLVKKKKCCATFFDEFPDLLSIICILIISVFFFTLKSCCWFIKHCLVQDVTFSLEKKSLVDIASNICKINQ